MSAIKKTITALVLMIILAGCISSDQDSDNDGLTDEEEAVLKTNPYQADTDGDGISDRVDPNPLVPAGSAPTTTTTGGGEPTAAPATAPPTTTQAPTAAPSVTLPPPTQPQTTAPPTTTAAPTPEPLSSFEEELVGLWARYHRYDGSTKYIRLNADRTACKWEEASGSNRRKGKSSYFYWEISKELSNNRFKVYIEGSGLSGGYTFDFPKDVLYPTDFSNLIYGKSTSGKICE